MGDETWELPPAEHPVGIYLGLVISTIILGLGSIVLFISLYTVFKNEGFDLTSMLVGRVLLFFASAYGAVASVSALYTIVDYQRVRVKKVEKEFKEFTVYARPLVEEVIRQRLVSQNVAEQLEQLKNRESYKAPSEETRTSWNETLILVAILGNITVGLYLFHDRNPWSFVPYSLMFLAIAWWLVIAWHFDFINDTRSYYIPAIYVLLVPSLSIILRGYLEIPQVLFLVFSSLLPYVLGMYAYYSYVTLGTLPSFIPTRFRGATPSPDLSGEGVEPGLGAEGPGRLKEFLPPKKKGE